MWLAVGVAWTLFSNAATARDNLLSAETQKALATERLLTWLPKWDWHVWLIGLLVLVILCLLDGAYRKYSKETDALGQNIAKLQLELDRYGRPDIQGEIQDYTGGAVYNPVPQMPGQPLIPDVGGPFRCYRMTMRVYFANHTHVSAALKHFVLEVKDSEGVYYSTDPDVGVIRPYDAAQGMPVEHSVLNLWEEIGALATPGRAFEGYLRFELTDMKELRPEAKLALIIQDSLGNNHRISRLGYVRPRDRVIINLPTRESAC
jgi:hypothetical protein